MNGYEYGRSGVTQGSDPLGLDYWDDFTGGLKSLFGGDGKDHWTPAYYNDLTNKQAANAERLVQDGKMSQADMEKAIQELNAATKAVVNADIDLAQAKVDAVAAVIVFIPGGGIAVLYIEAGQVAVDVIQGQYLSAGIRVVAVGVGAVGGAALGKLNKALKGTAKDGIEAAEAAESKLAKEAEGTVEDLPKCKGEPGGPPCFPPGTLVLMADGTTKAIEDIKEGDDVLADDPDDRLPASAHPVTFVSENFTLRLIHVEIDNDGDGIPDGEFAATGHHPIWTNNRGWQWAVDLTEGDILRDNRPLAHGACLTVVRSSEERTICRTYNLSVQGVHTFFVVASDGTAVLVHNADFPGQTFFPFFDPLLVHGNSRLFPGPTYLYGLYDRQTGGLMKWGIYNEAAAPRYPESFLKNYKLERLAVGSRDEMLRLERFLTETRPGPWNNEAWAGTRVNERIPLTIEGEPISCP